MKFGVFDHVDSASAALPDYYENRLRLAEKYDQSGIHAYHVAEHHGTPLGMAPSPGIYLASAIQRTRKLLLGPMVYCLPMYNPLRLLEEICMLDQMSEGRFQLGVGRGISPVEAGFYGLNPAETAARYQEALDFILQGLKGGDFSFEGQYYRASDMPMVLEPFQKPHPPLWYGTASPEAAVWAAANKINVISNQPPERVRAITDAYRDAWREGPSGDEPLPLLGMACHVVVAETEKEALESARRGYLSWRSNFMYLWNRAGRPPATVSYPDEFDGLARNGLAIAGTPDQVADGIGELVTQAGINYFVCRIAFGDLSFDEADRTISLLSTQIMPALQKEAA